MSIYRRIRPAFFRLDAERAHHLGIVGARLSAFARPLVRGIYSYQDTSLSQDLFGLHFRNPVGIAAGLDKNAELVKFWDAAGVGHMEVGSVTARASAGNPKPRAFRLKADEALINRMGLNNIGAKAVGARLAGRRKTQMTLGVNITKTHDPNILGSKGLDDFCLSFETLAESGDFVTLNVSCPNTAEGKTFEDPASMIALLDRVFEIRNSKGLSVPILVKLSPVEIQRAEAKDSLDELLKVLSEYPLAGLVMTNTSNSRDQLKTSSAELDRIGRGGLSGKPLCGTALEMTRYVFRNSRLDLPIIGVGGIHDGPSAWSRICAGASLLQIYTALVYEGPSLVKEINMYIASRLRSANLSSISEAVGNDSLGNA